MLLLKIIVNANGEIQNKSINMSYFFESNKENKMN